MSVEAMLAGRRVCVCMGPGGVGKTTLAAATALGMAVRGLKVAVITIDPARRLAESLGLERIGNEPARVALNELDGVDPRGELWAMMLDVRRTLDELVELLVPDTEARAQLLGNRVYRQLAEAVAGTHELMAMAKLHELHEAGDYDLLVLDTPPSRNALDFLEAPDRLDRFLQSRALQMLLRSAGVGTRLLGGGSAAALRLLRRVTGFELLEDVAEFLVALGTARAGFHDRAVKVRRLLREQQTAFLLVTLAEAGPSEEALFLAEKLAAAGMGLAGLLINRLHHDEIAGLDVESLAATLSGPLGAPLALRAARNLAEYHAFALESAAHEVRLRAALPGVASAEVPWREGEVNDVRGLAEIARFLFAEERERRSLMNGLVC